MDYTWSYLAKNSTFIIKFKPLKINFSIKKKWTFNIKIKMEAINNEFLKGEIKRKSKRKKKIKFFF